MKTSNKILLVFTLSIIVTIFVTHANVYTKSKKGQFLSEQEFVAFREEKKYDSIALTSFKHIICNNINGLSIGYGSQQKMLVQKELMPRFKYKINGDTLTILSTVKPFGFRGGNTGDDYFIYIPNIITLSLANSSVTLKGFPSNIIEQITATAKYSELMIGNNYRLYDVNTGFSTTVSNNVKSLTVTLENEAELYISNDSHVSLLNVIAKDKNKIYIDDAKCTDSLNFIVTDSCQLNMPIPLLRKVLAKP